MAGALVLLGLLTLAGAESSAAELVVHAGLPYLEDDEPKHRLDLTLPAPGVSGFPTVLLVHGGSLTSGDRTEAPFPALCRTFAAAGIACAAPSYRLFPAVSWPAPLEDVADAAAWVHRSIARFGGDSRRIALVGHSSGCLLVALLATDVRPLAARGLVPRSFAGVAPIGCRLDPRLDTGDATEAQIAEFFRRDPYERGFGDLATFDAANPSRYTGAHVPPVRVLLADAERFFPPVLEEGARFVRLLLEAGVDADLVVFAGRRHASLLARMVEPADPAFEDLSSWIEALPPADQAQVAP